MSATPIAHLVVPTGTAAATVVAQEPSPDPAIESRRFARLEALEPVAFRAQLEELIVQGVYTALHGRLLILRVIGGGRRTFGVVVSLGDAAWRDTTAIPRSGLFTRPTVVEFPEEHARAIGVSELVEAEARQRPMFHGVTSDGTTYSGFVVQHPTTLLEALSQLSIGEIAPAPLAVLSLGSSIEVPPGLLVAMEPATE
jgi:hypothetical protein